MATARRYLSSFVTFGCFVLFGTALTLTSVAAAVPPLISYQGFIQHKGDDGGKDNAQSVNGKNGTGREGKGDGGHERDRDFLPMSFSLFADSLGGTPLWTEAYAKVHVEDGAFSVLLGSITPLPPAVFSGTSLWLETAVAGSVLSPRFRIVTVGYSFRAAVADSAIHAATSADSVWARKGEDIYRLTGRVGIGTASPSSELTVKGTTTTSVLEITGGSDIAEPFRCSMASAASPSPAPGMAVSIDPKHVGQLTVSSEPYDAKVVGVLSGANGVMPGLVLRQVGAPGVEGECNVALAGRVWAYANASNGAIRPGDLVTTSQLPGQLMKATDRGRSRGAVIGKAMTELSVGEGIVLVLVQPQ